MLQHKWTIHQGNVACLSDWPWQGTGCDQATHSVFLPFSWAVCEMLFSGTASVCVCVCICASVCHILSGSYTGGRVLAAAVILVRSFVVALLGALKVVTH